MIAVDTNVLIYANREESVLHGAALKALRLLAEGDEAWAIPVFCIGEFLQIISHDRLFDPPTPAPDALALGATLVTNNTRHFAHAAGLAVENWLLAS